MLSKEEIEKAKEMLNKLKNCKVLVSGGFVEILTEEEKETIEILLQYIDQLEQKNKKQNKMIDEMVDAIVGDKKILALTCKHIIKMTNNECEKQNLLCDDCIKQYFEKKVEENNV